MASLSLDDLSALQRENREYQRALQHAVSSLKDRAPSVALESATSSDTLQPSRRTAGDHDLVEELQSEVRRLRRELGQRAKVSSAETHTMCELARNLECTTNEIENKTRALTTAMDTIQDLEQRLAEHTRLGRAKLNLLAQQEKAAALERANSDLLATTARLTTNAEQDAKTKKRYERHLRDASAKLTTALAELAVHEQTRATLSDIEAASRSEKTAIYDQLEEAKTMLARVQKEMGDRIGRREARISQLKMALFDATQDKLALEDRVQHFQLQLESLARTEGKRQEQLAADRSATDERLRLANDAIDRERDRSLLFQREMRKLQQQLMACEEARQADAKRHAQALLGKDKASSYVWDKYVEAVAPTRAPRWASDAPSILPTF
ncbi:hypothetical protein ACHHYP_10062 [Achlya hypogyna]|uniref:Uncharacterized protein n=1 Tax=Achlya hypogyna TaxID=1202772 RepID=A0A1V9ZI96_ACHHY|nr:hypothetical protein ACHHYP_10062 [Achlya hypogyna]